MTVTIFGQRVDLTDLPHYNYKRSYPLPTLPVASGEIKLTAAQRKHRQQRDLDERIAAHGDWIAGAGGTDEKDQFHAVFEDFTAADFSDVDLTWAIFHDCDFTDADFTDADLYGVKFVGCDLTGAVFAGAALTKVTFRRCKGFDHE